MVKNFNRREIEFQMICVNSKIVQTMGAGENTRKGNENRFETLFNTQKARSKVFSFDVCLFDLKSSETRVS